MPTTAIRIIIILDIVLSCSVSARYIDSRDENDTIRDWTRAVFVEGYCYEEGEHKHEYVPVRRELGTDYDEATLILREIHHHKGPHHFNSGAYMKEFISTVYDKKDSIIFFRHYIWKYDKLVQTTDDGITKIIIQGETPCDLIVTESFGDITILHLDPKEQVKGSVKRCGDLYDTSPKHYKCGKYDAIINAWHPICAAYHYEQKLNASSDSSLHAKNKTGTSSYKYYIIILVCIMAVIAVGIVIIYKKRRNKEDRIRDEYPCY